MSETSPAEQDFTTTLPNFDIQHLTDALDQYPAGKVKYVHIGGVSSSGKSTISRILANQLPNSKVLSIDSYLVEGLSNPERVFNHLSQDPARPYIGGISPDIWDLGLVEEHLTSLSLGESVEVPVFDETIKDRVGYELFEPAEIIILEGGHSFSERFRDTADYRILVNAPLHDRIVRKLVRTHLLYGRTDIEEVLDRYCLNDEPVRQVYQSEFEAIADQVIYNPANPESDFAHFQETPIAESVGVFYPMIPKIGCGQLHPTELLGIVQLSEGTFNLRYQIANKRIIDLPIPAETIDLLMKYYELGQ